ARLSAFADFLKANPSLSVAVVGHTSNVGTAAGNLTLSQTRATTVRNFLIGAGIDAARLNDSGKGQTEPVDSNTTPAGQANNDRVELVVNHWIPLTDQFPTLSMSTIAISP